MNIAIRRKAILWLKPRLAKKYFKILSAPPSGYCEHHHILPKSVFPEYSKEKENLVKIPVLDHFRAHEILASIDSYEMHLAFHMMFSQSIKRYSMLSLREKEEIASKQAQARKNMAQAQSIRKKGRFLGKENSFYGKTHSPEMKLKLSSVHKGKKLTDKHIAILVSCHKGKPKRKVKCPHCGIMIANHAKNRRHFDNCKEK